jgi:hypothetical protein
MSNLIADLATAAVNILDSVKNVISGAGSQNPTQSMVNAINGGITGLTATMTLAAQAGLLADPTNVALRASLSQILAPIGAVALVTDGITGITGITGTPYQMHK